MRLIGYIKELIENSFSIPVYENKNKYYSHNLDSDFKILSFYETNITDEYLVKYNTYKDFKISDFGALVFIGFNNIVFIESANIIIDRIGNYINETTVENKYLLTKDEILDLKNKLFRNDINILVDNKGYSVENFEQIARLKSHHHKTTGIVGFNNANRLRAINEASAKLKLLTTLNSPVNILVRKPNEFVFNYDISDITVDDVTNFLILNQSKNKYKILYNNTKYIRLRLILNEFIAFHNIRYLGASSKQHFLNVMTEKVSVYNYRSGSVVVDYGTAIFSVNNPLKAGEIISGRSISSNKRK